MRRLGREREERIPNHPYRDSALVYGGLAVVLIVFTAATGGPLLPKDSSGGGLLGAIGRFGALTLACVFFVVATAFSWWKWRARLEEERRSR